LTLHFSGLRVEIGPEVLENFRPCVCFVIDQDWQPKILHSAHRVYFCYYRSQNK